MRIAILGRHPIPQPGFCGVMSVYEATWLSRAGDTVDLYIPFSTADEHATFLRRAGAEALDNLDKFGGDYAIRPIYLDAPRFDGAYDALIWQSTSPDDWASLIAPARNSAQVITKSFPKFVAFPDHIRDRSVLEQLDAFDLVACALKEDYNALLGEQDLLSLYAHKLCYVPRGADPDLLNPLEKAHGPPVIGMDTPNVADPAAIAHYIPALEMLKKEYPELRVLSLGRSVPLPWAESLSFRPYPDLCRDFFNKVWFYLVIDYRHSGPHIQAPIHKLMPSEWGARAIYEVQNVEAQMSGAAIVGHPENVIQEIVSPGVSWLRYDDYGDSHAIAALLARGIENFAYHREGARRWALDHHNWCNSIRRWRDAISGLVDSGYRRESTRALTGASGPLPADDTPITAPPRPAADQDCNQTEFDARKSSGARNLPPAFDTETSSFVSDQYRCSNIIVEYGSGGSTLLAASNEPNTVLTVDSSLPWLKEVMESCRERDLPGKIIPLWCDVGETKEWGYPVTTDKWSNFQNYAKLPWLYAQEHLLEPQLVLIDGRFRISCFLSTCIYSRKPVRILFDDYVDRANYHLVESILRPTVIIANRMAVFDVVPGLIAPQFLLDHLGLFYEPSR